MIIEQIYTYPIKSFPAIKLDSNQFNRNGFHGDRFFCMYTPEGEMQTRRNRKGMADFNLILNDLNLTLHSKKLNSSVIIDLKNDEEKVALKVWSRREAGGLVNNEVNEFLSDHFGERLLLYNIKNEGQGFSSFHDDSPILICNKATLDYIEEMTSEKIDIMRFRPNIVVKSMNPFEEGSWTKLRVNDVDLNPVKLCSRCIIINQNPETALVDFNLLKLLKPYTSSMFKIKFGLYVNPTKSGCVKLGDELFAQS